LPDGKPRFPAPSPLLPRKRRRAVDSLKAQGVDFIKVKASFLMTRISPRCEAHKVGLPFVGHVPDKVASRKPSPPTKEHRAPDGQLEGCSTKEDAFIAGQAT